MLFFKLWNLDHDVDWTCCKMYKVLCCGSNGSGQLGVGHKRDLCELTECFRNNHRVLDIACGSNHTLLLLESGEAYACGSNISGLTSLENLSENEEEMFMLIGQDEKTYKKIAAGWDFSILVDSSNKVHTQGDLRLCGGLGEAVQEVKTLTEVYHSADDDVVEIHTSLHSIIIIHSSGKVLAWGNNKKGQLFGDCKTLDMVYSPLSLSFDDLDYEDKENLRVVRCAMGRDYTFFHVLNTVSQSEFIIMRSKNDRYKILQGLCNAIGDGHIEGNGRRSRWFRIKKGICLKRLKSMWSSVHVMYSTEEKSSVLKSFGNNVFGQLFPGLSTEVADFDVGTEHGVCLEKSEKKVCSWGWGEHGNCGVQKLTTKVNEMYSCDENKTIDSAIGGYATTWIIVKS